MESTTPARTKSLSLKEQILQQPRGKPVPVDMRRFPEWPQNLFMKPPSSGDIAAWEQDGISFGKKGKVEVKVSRTRKAKLIQITLCEADGTLIFQAGEVGEIAKLDAPVVNHLFSAARAVAGQDTEDEDDDDEDLEGN